MTDAGPDAMTPGAADRLTALARAVVRLSPSRHDPEKFHIDKNKIAAALRRLAAELAA
jgi:hypothetical protein